MPASARFPDAPLRRGMYESFYLRAVSPQEPVGVWIRHTVHKRPRQRPKGSIWCTVFDARRGRPFMHKLTTDELTVPAGGWIAVGHLRGYAAETDARSDDGAPPDSGSWPESDAREGSDADRDGASLTPGRAQGACGPARWSLRFVSKEPELRHLPWRWLYRAPLPRTKLTSPAPSATFDGSLEVAGQGAIELSGWPGMVGHNWGSEHAERWIWLHGILFEDAPEAWLDVALGRVKVAGRMTPWVANGALALDGRRYRVGGLSARGLRVAETPTGCVLTLPGEDGLTIEARLRVPPGAAAGWRYADPGHGEHDVINCSVAELELSVRRPGAGATRVLRTAHGAAYELGMRERDHGVPIAPFPDG